ncbi:MAG: hypothetical protein NZM43_09725 [Saprospiraceae bacterium]|nr:hypothetical protein [Saprospiraceae bacterium]MDW8484594.1 hypothetical protein [Saprospiraceae bacterium]
MVSLTVATSGFSTRFCLPEKSPAALNTQAFTVSATSNGPLCAGATLHLAAIINFGTPPFTFSWKGPGGFHASGPNPSRVNTAAAHSGVYSVTVTDGTGATASATVNVQIYHPPTVNAGLDKALCPGASCVLKGTIGGSATSALWSASVPGGMFVPNPQVLNATYIPPVGFTGKITLTLTTDDPPGPCPAVSDQVVLTYATPGPLVCDDTVHVSASSHCPVTLTPDMVLEGDVLDDLYTVTVFAGPGQNLGNTVSASYFHVPLTVRIQDNCSGNFCIVTAIIEDKLPPTFVSCPNLTLPCLASEFTPGYLDTVLKVLGARPTVTDNCSPVVLTYKDAWTNVGCQETFQGQTDLTGYIRRSWVATDANGNTSTCVQYLYIKRLRAQDLTFPPDVTLSCDYASTDWPFTGTPYYLFNGVKLPLEPTNACGVGVSYSDQVTFRCDGEYAILRTWQLVNGSCPDTSPITLQRLQAIYVLDETGPKIYCPGNLTVSTDLLSCCATVDLPDVIIEDACSSLREASATIFVRDSSSGNIIQQLSIAGQLSSFSANHPLRKDTLAVFKQTPCLPLGNHIIQYSSEDVCGASSTCSFTLSVIDFVPPTAACLEVTQVSLGVQGVAFVQASTFHTGSYDGCSPVYFKARRKSPNNCQDDKVFHDQVKFCCEDVGKRIEVVLRVYDVPVPSGSLDSTQFEGRSNDCVVSVLVDDKIKPMCIPPAHVTVNCENFDFTLAAYGKATGADNCCVDTIFEMSADWTQFDTLCSKGTLVRFFQVRDCHGKTSTCSQRIVVNHNPHYYIRFPDDVVLSSCNGTADFGQPKFLSADCGSISVSHTDRSYTAVPGACQQIERTWRVLNWCTFNPNKNCIQVPNPNPHPQVNHPSNLVGPIVSAPGTPFPWAPTVVKITPSDAQPTLFSEYWAENANCYEYKQLIRIIDGQKPVVTTCPSAPQNICDQTDNDSNLWNQPYWLDVRTLAHDLCEAPVELRITATDDCSKSNLTFRYQLFLDLDGNGSMETVVTNQHTDAGVVFFNNASNPNFIGGEPRSFDQRPVPADQKYRFTLETRTNNNERTAVVRWNTAAQPDVFVEPQLPHGVHKIKWFVSDGCGNEQVCEYAFTIRDCKAPTVVCATGLSGNIGANKTLTVNHYSFVQSASDNCTPAHQLVFGMRKKGQGTGFPYLSNGAPQNSITLDCADVGFIPVEIWVKDLEGNADFCQTYFHVQNNHNYCSTAQATVAGAVLTTSGEGVEEAHVSITCQAINGAPPFTKKEVTDTEGHYRFDKTVPIAVNYTLTPTKNNDPLNGVSTFDLVLINRHILALEKFTSPYQYIAADINNSRSVTTFDILELRKLILGVYTEFPNNTSWRFVDKDYRFPDPTNPWKEIFPEHKSVWNFQASRTEDDFVAVKVGDVNGNAIANSATFVNPRFGGTWLLDVNDRFVKAGEVFSIVFFASEPVAGCQFTLQYEGADCLSIDPAEGISADYLAHFPDQAALTVAIDKTIEAGQPLFALRLRAKGAGRISQMLRLSSSITRSEAYPNLHGEERFAVGLRFNDERGEFNFAGLPFELYQNVPNPWVNKTWISFYLPEAAEATLAIHDEVGRLRFVKTAFYAAGYNTVLFEHPGAEAEGTWTYTLYTPFGSATRKMMRVR